MGKNVAPILLVIIGIGLVVLNSAFGYSMSKIQDITVSNYNGVLHCDQIECPLGTELCHVLKQTSEDNLSEIKRENICYHADGGILDEKLWTEVGSSNKVVYVHIDMYLNGRISSTSSTSQSYP